MAAPVRSDFDAQKQRAHKLRTAVSRLVRLTSLLAALSTLVFVLALFGLLPARTPEQPAHVKYDPERAVDPPRPFARAADVLPVHRLLSWSYPVCAAPERGARLYRLTMHGAAPSFALFCLGEYVLLDVDLASEPPRVTRLARFPHRGELPGGAAALDLDRDGALDLVLGVSPREGVVHRPPAGLFWLRGRAQGGYEPARALIEMPVVSALAVDLDGDSKSELVALTRGDAAAQRAGELWLFAGGSSPSRAAVLPTALAPGDLTLGAEREGERDLWVLSRQPGSLVRMRFARAPEAWANAVRDSVPLLGAQAFVGGCGTRICARDAQRVYSVDPSAAAAPSALTDPAELGPAVWLERGGAQKRALLSARAQGFAVQSEGERTGRERTVPLGKSVVDVASAGGASNAEQGVLLLRSEEQPATLALVVLPAGMRDEASEIELRTAEVAAAPGEPRVPLE